MWGREVMDDLETTKSPVTLVIGDKIRWKNDNRDLPQITGLHFVGPEDITPELISRVAPEIVLSPLVVRDIDAIEIARKLSAVGFEGRYRVLSSDLPRPETIEAEVNEAAPRIDFGLLNLTKSDAERE